MAQSNYFKSGLLILISLVNISATRDVTRVFTTTIAPYKTLQYQAFYKELCLKPAEGYVDHLPELDYQWGYTYKVKLKETHLENPPQDASAYTYELLKIQEKTPVDQDFSFKMTITPDVYLGYGETNPSSLVQLNDSTFRYLDEINILVGKNHVTQWDSLFQSGKDFKPTFMFETHGYIRLVTF